VGSAYSKMDVDVRNLASGIYVLKILDAFGAVELASDRVVIRH